MGDSSLIKWEDGTSSVYFWQELEALDVNVSLEITWDKKLGYKATARSPKYWNGLINSAPKRGSVRGIVSLIVND